ncbi:hypothetical protein UCRPC4_g01690 [Phaeomoniella chlamydospora]|uniref:Uncharacterized protein n=1 Tax=Phaeomoniella chlamydospora TaxID=158046 RepID=A0A0G2ETV2_PHACM|nr:hypothetical protein UCRPC4_g01690 [Phaeomoniella chlamydospora]
MSATDHKDTAQVAHSTGTNYQDNKATSRASVDGHGAAEIVDTEPELTRHDAPREKRSWREKLSFFSTKEFWTILILGQILAIANTSTSTLTTLLDMQGTSIPAFQTLFNYVLLNAIFSSYTIYRYGIKGWARMVMKDGWKYIILAFCDVEGNYFTVLAYRYTTILSAQLINFWAIVVVVVISFTFLGVRYHWAQILGIFICIAGMGLLLASDHISGTNGGDISRGNQIKGDLFALVGATGYGLSNIAEEFFVSKKPMYEVVGQLGFWAMIINGVQAAIFDRHSFQTATWNGKVGGYLTGYTLILTLFYSLAPILYRLASAAFMNISLLTGNFWGVVIGIKVFHYTIHYLYPPAFVLIMIGHFVYYFGKGVLGEAKKAWLGENQERGIVGFATARSKILASDGTIGIGHQRRNSVIEHEGAGAV